MLYTKKQLEEWLKGFVGIGIPTYSFGAHGTPYRERELFVIKLLRIAPHPTASV
jgi:hypothetical protein